MPPQRGAARTHQQEAGLLQVRRGHGSARSAPLPSRSGRRAPAALPRAPSASRPARMTSRQRCHGDGAALREGRARGALAELWDIGSDIQGWISEVHRSPQQSQPVPA